MSAPAAAPTTEGLPKQFVTSLRILFDILDEERTGFVRLTDIESRWHEEGVKGLPSGVIDSLRKVAPRNGKLNFEAFVTGLKLSLLRNNSSGNAGPLVSHNAGKDKTIPRDGRDGPVSALPRKQNEAYKPSNNQHDPKEKKSAPNMQRSRPNSSRQLPSNTAAVRPNNILQSQNIELRNQIYSREQMQQSSMRQQVKHDTNIYREQGTELDNRNKLHHMKQLDENHVRRKDEHTVQKNRPKSVELQRTRDTNLKALRHMEIPHGRPERPPPYRSQEQNDVTGMTVRPERPPPYRKTLEKDMPPTIPPRNQQGRIMQELKQWHRDNNIDSQGRMHTAHSDSKLLEKAHGNDIYVNIDQIRQQAALFKRSSPTTTKGSAVRRQNSRRHTLSSGIDYNVMRRLKQLEQEKDELLQGLAVVDEARAWYLMQIAALTETQHNAHNLSCTDMTLQATQDRMNFIRSRIVEVNLNLRSLMETSEKGFPAHMNLAVRSNPVSGDNSAKWLKDQNKQLTKEVGEKSEKITQLEKEKATLIRELFEARSRHKTSYDDTTFM